MPLSVTTGAVALCSFGVAPSTLNFLPLPRVMVEGRPVGTITDIIPFVNIPPFGVCTSMTNPTVAAATAAALGVLTPMPCVPVIAGPWKPGSSKTILGGKPALTSTSTCNCAFGGAITITMPGPMKTLIN